MYYTIFVYHFLHSNCGEGVHRSRFIDSLDPEFVQRVKSFLWRLLLIPVSSYFRYLWSWSIFLRMYTFTAFMYRIHALWLNSGSPLLRQWFLFKYTKDTDFRRWITSGHLTNLLCHLKKLDSSRFHIPCPIRKNNDFIFRRITLLRIGKSCAFVVTGK